MSHLVHTRKLCIMEAYSSVQDERLVSRKENWIKHNLFQLLKQLKHSLSRGFQVLHLTLRLPD